MIQDFAFLRKSQIPNYCWSRDPILSSKALRNVYQAWCISSVNDCGDKCTSCDCIISQDGNERNCKRINVPSLNWEIDKMWIPDSIKSYLKLINLIAKLEFRENEVNWMSIHWSIISMSLLLLYFYCNFNPKNKIKNIRHCFQWWVSKLKRNIL